MPLVGKGLVKLIEECGELQQIAAKKLTFPDTDEHPDGKGSMKTRMEEEIADVMAALIFVIVSYDLNQAEINARCHRKGLLFCEWAAE